MLTSRQRGLETAIYALMACPSCSLQRWQFLKRIPLYKPYLRLSVTNEEIRRTRKKGFPGQRLIINCEEDEKIPYNKRIIDKLLNSDIVGFDTETKPEYQLGKTNTNNIALVQIATDDYAVLWRIHRCQKTMVPSQLSSILRNRHILKVGHALNNEVEDLYRQYNIEVKNIIDTQAVARQLGSSRLALTALTAMFCGWTITKSQQRSNWEREALTPEQVSYAATDAWATLQVFERMKRLVETLHLDLPASIATSVKLVMEKDYERDHKMWKKMDKILLEQIKRESKKKKMPQLKMNKLPWTESTTSSPLKKSSSVPSLSESKCERELQSSTGTSLGFAFPVLRKSKKSTDMDTLDGLLWNIRGLDRSVWLWAADKGPSEL